MPDPVTADEARIRSDPSLRRAPVTSRRRTRMALAVGACAVVVAAGIVYGTTRHAGTGVSLVGPTSATPRIPIRVSLRGARTVSLPRSPLVARSGAATTWTGREMLIWGGQARGGTPLDDGASYTPSTGRWKMLPTSPLGARFLPSFSAWTGHSWIVWGHRVMQGGQEAGGAAYVPATGRWVLLPSAPPAIELRLQTEVWTGTEMIVVATNGATRPAFAAAYSPATNRWHRIASPGAVPTNAASPGAVWTGHEAIFLMQDDDNVRNGQFLDAYDPARNTWARTSSQTVPWTGAVALVWGPTPRPLAFDPATGQWARFDGGARAYRDNASVVWTGHSLLGWGGQPATGDPDRGLDSGMSYTP